MALNRSDLQPAFNIPGTWPFSVWGCGTRDSVKDVLAPGYFNYATEGLREGDLIFVRRLPPLQRGEAEPTKAFVRNRERGHMMLLVVDTISPGRPVTVRLAQDFGHPTPQPDTAAETEAEPDPTPKPPESHPRTAAARD